jgi:hypothetical protein
MLVVYDVTVRESWVNVKRWVEDVRRMLPEHEPMVRSSWVRTRLRTTDERVSVRN